MSEKYDKDRFKRDPIYAREMTDKRELNGHMWMYEARGGLEVYYDNGGIVGSAWIPARVMREFLRIEDSRKENPGS